MAVSQPSMSPLITIRRRGGWKVSFLWVGVTVVGAVLASLVAWRLRSLNPHSVSAQQLVAYIVAVQTELLISAGQWLVLRRFKVEAYWWIPASLAADVVAAVIIPPPVLNPALFPGADCPLKGGGGPGSGVPFAAVSG